MVDKIHSETKLAKRIRAAKMSEGAVARAASVILEGWKLLPVSQPTVSRLAARDFRITPICREAPYHVLLAVCSVLQCTPQDVGQPDIYSPGRETKPASSPHEPCQDDPKKRNTPNTTAGRRVAPAEAGILEDQK